MGSDLTAFLKMPLVRQCEALGVRLQTLTLQRSDLGWTVEGLQYTRPEDAALAHLRYHGWEGVACEGTAVLMLMKAACLDRLASLNTFESREDACMRFFEAQCILHRDRAPELLYDIGQADAAIVKKNLAEITSQFRYRSIYPMMDPEALLEIWHSITPTVLAKFAQRIFDSPDYRAGWPDLTVARDGHARFVEVKTTDKLHASQYGVIQSILQPSGADVQVLRIQCASVSDG